MRDEDQPHLTDEESEAVSAHLAGDTSPETWAKVEAAMKRIVHEMAPTLEQEYQERKLHMVFRDCPECGHSIGCMLQEDGTVLEPKGCAFHT